VQTGVKILAGFALVKVVALTSGPGGLAQLGQFQNLVGLVTILSGGMFYTGVTKLVSEHGETYEKLLVIASIVLAASVVCTLVIASLFAFWEGWISEYVLKDVHLDWIFPALPLLIFLSVLNGLWLALLNGLRRIRELVLANIAASVLMVLFVLVLAPRFGQKGVFLSILLPPAIVILIVFLRRFRRQHWTAMCISGLANKPLYGELARFALMGLVSAAAAPLAQMVMRDYLTQTLSLSDAGIWQGLTRISEVYLVFITSSLSVYYLPKLAQISDAASLKKLTTSVLRLVIPVSLLLGTLIYISRDILIWLLFTPEFNTMRDLFFWQIVGDMVKIIAWVFAYIVLARGAVIPFVVGELLFNATYVMLGMLLVPKFGLEGVVLAHGVNYILYLFFIVVVVRAITCRIDGVKPI
jgi:PST family polysaccharide transporter